MECTLAILPSSSIARVLEIVLRLTAVIGLVIWKSEEPERVMLSDEEQERRFYGTFYTNEEPERVTF